MKKTKRPNSRRKIQRQRSELRRSEKTDTQAAPDTMPIVHPNAGGIDVSSKDAYVCVPQHTVKAGQARIRSFGVFSEEMDGLVGWLKACGVDTVAMEATGIYWVVLYDKLEAAGIEVVLVNPRYVKHVPGRKSDVLDCQWLQQLHMCGLLSGSFRPAAAVRYLRTLMRQRQQLTRSCGRCVQQMQKALVQMNVQLNLVVSDIDGDTGLRIIRAILTGERNPKELVKLRDERITKSTPEQMEAALQGEYHPEQLFLLQQGLDAMEFYHRQMDDCDKQIAKALEAFAPAQSSTAQNGQEHPAAATAKKSRKSKSRGNAPKQDFRPLLEQIIGVDLTRVPGLNMLSVLILISEIGLDMSKWRNVKAFCSWLGLCPATDISGGKVLSRGTRHVVNRAATVLRVSATVVGRTDTWLGSFYRRKRAHLGAPKAITATARKLACVIYHMLKQGEQYVEIDTLVYEIKAQQHRLCKLRKQAEILGFDLVQRTAPA
jgi:transposase